MCSVGCFWRHYFFRKHKMKWIFTVWYGDSGFNRAQPLIVIVCFIIHRRGFHQNACQSQIWSINHLILLHLLLYRRIPHVCISAIAAFQCPVSYYLIWSLFQSCPKVIHKLPPLLCQWAIIVTSAELHIMLSWIKQKLHHISPLSWFPVKTKHTAAPKRHLTHVGNLFRENYVCTCGFLLSTDANQYNFTAICGEAKGILLSVKIQPCCENHTQVAIIQNTDDINRMREQTTDFP